MNAINPSPSSGASALPVPTAKINPEPPVRLPRLLLGLALAVAIFDLCFWGINVWGFSVAVFFPALAGIILGNRESLGGRRTTSLLMVLLAGAAVAAAIETSITNTFVLLALIIALAGDTFFRDIESAWGRWHSQAIALAFAPGRIFWLGARLLEAAFGGGLGWTGGLIGGCLLAVPALVLALVFGSLLASGNAVFGSWTNSFFDWFWKELALYLNPGRIALWFFAAFLVLPLLRPARVAAWWWKWTGRMPRLPEIIPSRAALFSSGLVLVVLNLLFFIANIADAVFLWSGQALPGGVTYSGYVHHGVNSLIATVILSAFVLVTIFQQELKVAQRRELKLFGMIWIAQNLFLLLSVALRLKLYIEAYDMTVARLSVMIFLALAAVGYALLAIKIMRVKSLSWLVGGCVLAVFATSYLTQFLDLAGWSANYNVARWEKDRTRNLDASYLYSVGPAAWPALRRAHEIDPTIPILNVEENRGYLSGASTNLAKFDAAHWREFSLRAWMNRGALEEKPNN
jgi:MFS family permease